MNEMIDLFGIIIFKGKNLLLTSNMLSLVEFGIAKVNNINIDNQQNKIVKLKQHQCLLNHLFIIQKIISFALKTYLDSKPENYTVYQFVSDMIGNNIKNIIVPEWTKKAK